MGMWLLRRGEVGGWGGCDCFVIILSFFLSFLNCWFGSVDLLVRCLSVCCAFCFVLTLG